MDNVIKLFKHLTIMLLALAGIANAQQVEVTASVDRNPVMADESFNLTVIANGDVDSNAFDASVLMKDFVVGRTSVSSQTQIINFKTNKNTTWNTVLIPRKKGRFTIPAFDVAGSKTKPIDIMVVPVSTSNSGKTRELFITTEVDVNRVYLQQQVHYTVKLHLARDLQRGSLSSPTLENADIRQIGKDKEYNEIVDGVRYRIIERSFAIIPQQSGSFTIEGPLFEGEVVDNNRQSFGFFNRSKAVNRIGPEQTIQVLPIPSNYNYHWLPSEFVQLDDEWQGNGAYTVGEPITRTLTLTAVGVVEQQLPSINSQYPDSIKTYPDQAETTTIEKDKTLIAQRKESVAIIPSQAGQLVLPEVKIPWFNTITQKTEYATLPEKTINVQPDLNQPAIPVQPSAPQNVSTDNTTSQHQAASEQTIAQQAPRMQGVATYWQWLGLLLALLWLLTLLAWRLHVLFINKRLAQHKPSQVRTTDTEKALWKSLEKALNKNQPGDIINQLTPWLGQITSNKQASLEQSLQGLQDNELNQQIDKLLSTRYAKHSESWKSTELHRILRNIRKRTLRPSQASASLQPLYPQD